MLPSEQSSSMTLPPKTIRPACILAYGFRSSLKGGFAVASGLALAGLQGFPIRRRNAATPLVEGRQKHKRLWGESTLPQHRRTQLGGGDLLDSVPLTAYCCPTLHRASARSLQKSWAFHMSGLTSPNF